MTTSFRSTAATLDLQSGYSLGLEPGSTKWVTGIDGWYSAAPVERDKQKKVSRHGTFAVRGWKDERLVTVSGYYEAPDRGTAARFTDEINAVLADGTEGVLTVDDADLGVRFARVYLLKPDVIWTGGRGVAFHLDMVATDPRKYGPLVSRETSALANGDGMKWDMFATDNPGILDFGAAGTSGKITFVNEGRAPTSPVFKVHGPPDFAEAGDFKITEVETERVLEWRGRIQHGQELVLDSRTGTVVLEGTGDRIGGLIRNQWSEVPGNSSRTYQFEAVGGLTLTVEAYPAWW